MQRHRIQWLRATFACGRTASPGLRPACLHLPGFARLEERTLLSGPGGTAANLLAQTVPLALGSPLVGTVLPLSANYYVVTTPMAGKLSVSLQASVGLASVSLLDGAGDPLVQSSATPAAAGSIDVSVPAGENYLEVQCASTAVPYQITAGLVPSNPAFQPIPTDFPYSAAFAAGRLWGPGEPVDLATPDGIYVGNGDGTFQSPPVDGPLGEPGWFVSAVAVATLRPGGLPDVVYTEISPDFSSAELSVMWNEGGGEFAPGPSFAIDSDPDSIQTIDYGNGITDLAVADGFTNNVAIFVGDGHGGFSAGPVFYGGSSPQAMTAGRFGDGFVDLVVADSGETTGSGQGLTVFQSEGPSQFQLSTTIAVGAAPFAVAAGEFTGDGKLDLAVADEASDRVFVLLNRGDGTFLAPVAYDVGQAPTALVAADFGNGQVDLATANSNSGDVSILLGNGDGTFQSQLRFAAGPSPHAIAAADLNSDGRVDLAVANSNPNTISVLLGRGDGTFQDAAANPVGSDALAITTADLNRDGYNDAITADFYSNDVAVLLGNGDGTFQAARSYPAGIHPTAVVAGDFNGDGRLDLAVADAGNYDGTEAGVSILFGNGDGTFQPPSFYPGGALPWSIAAGDFTGNGILDLAVANLASNDVTILFGDGHGGFPSSIDVPLGNQADEPVSIVAGHFTGGPALDLAVGEQTSDTISILQNNGQGGFVALPPIPVLPASSLGGQPSSLVTVVAGDFLGTGHSQIAALSAGSDLAGTDQVSIIASSAGGFVALPPTVVGSGIAADSMVAGSFSGSSALGLAITEQYAGTVALLEGNGHGAFSTQTTLDVGSEQSLSVITAADFTGDGLLDLAIAASSPNSVAIELNLGSGQFASPSLVGLALRNNPVVADWSGDGASDVAIVDAAGDILFRQGLPGEPGQFAPPVTVNPGRPSRDIAAVTTSQGTLLASVDAQDNNVSLYAFNNGFFSLAEVLGTGMQPAQIVSADLLADGRDDLVIRNAGDGTLTVYLGNLPGAFLPPETLTVGPGICNVTVADV